MIEAAVLEIGDGYRAKNDELGGEGPIFLRSGHVTAEGIDFTDAERFRETDRSVFGAKIAQAGDVVVTTKGWSTGRVSFVNEGMPTFVYSPHLSYWRSTDRTRLDADFLRQWSRSSECQEQIDQIKMGIDIHPYLSLVTQRRLAISLPDVNAQRGIARVLGILDDRIELNRRMNETLAAIDRALFKSWFVDFDPVRAKAEGRAPSGMDAEAARLFPSEFVDSELGPIPRGWKVAALDTIADFRNGLALQKFRPGEGQPRLPVVKIAQLRTGQADSAEWARADIAPECILENGDVVFSWSGSLTVVVWCGGRAALNQHLFRVTSGNYPKWFYLQSLFVHLPEFQRIAGDKATTMGHIQRHHLTAAKCAVPPAELMAAAGRVFKSNVEMVVSRELESRMLGQVRDHLLPRLLSGKLPAGIVVPALGLEA